MDNRSVVLDALAEDEEGRLINVEMHPQEDEDHVRRVRYHLSGIDMSYLEKGNDFEAIPEVYLIYITKKDFIGRNKGNCWIIWNTRQLIMRPGPSRI